LNFHNKLRNFLLILRTHAERNFCRKLFLNSWEKIDLRKLADRMAVTITIFSFKNNQLLILKRMKIGCAKF
ncbi:hypothetical protein, partial [Liquorilactobacillus satsumensis]|uniref:hypothetical protein n=1 Tax=Liquorilactobacillus satsumensis TaxID=259059 RepID=UPI0039EAEFB4